MISALAWVPPGGMRMRPAKQELSTAEIAALRAELEEADEAEMVEAEKERDLVETEPAYESLRGVKVPDDEEEEEGAEFREGAARGAGDIASKGYATLELGEDEDDEDDEDDIDDLTAKAGDSFLLSTHTDEDLSCLEIYVYERASGSLYVHHDISLPAFPLSLSWLDCPPGSCGTVVPGPDGVGAGSGVGSFVAVGTFRPGIELWNLDVLDPLEPTLELGGLDRSSDGTELKEGSHEDAVMSLDWNRVHRQLLASGSADRTVKLWDIVKNGRGDSDEPLATFTHHRGKVQSVRWHSFPDESSVLASASYDRTVVVMDAREVDGEIMRLGLDADPEDLQWSPHDSWLLAASCESGKIQGWDMRNPREPLFNFQAHRGEATSISFAPTLRGVLASVGVDKRAAIWDVTSSSTPVELGRRPMGVGSLFTASWLTHEPAVLAVGGDGGKLAIWDIDGDNERLASTLRAGTRLVPPDDVPCLQVRPRPDGQPVHSLRSDGRTTEPEEEPKQEPKPKHKKRKGKK